MIREVKGGVINTVAGNGFVTYSGDGGQATSAELDYPSSAAVDAAGNLYIADFYNNVVREVSFATGVITTVAGDGMSGYSGDGNQASSAELNEPIGVAVDASGDLFIADSGNNVIREVSEGVISTVAGGGSPGSGLGDGGPATDAELADPTGVAVDTSGDLFIADSGDNVIREVSGGIITTVAGGGRPVSGLGDGGPATDAELADPTGVAVDGSGDLFIADNGNNVIREVSGGIINTIAGGGNPASGIGDGGPATQAKVSNPGGVAVDSSGNVYIADTGNEVVREVSGSVINTIAGDGNIGYSGDLGQATEAELNYPTGVAVDAAGNVYIADSNNNVIRQVVKSYTGARSVTVSPAPLTVAANNASMVYGVRRCRHSPIRSPVSSTARIAAWSPAPPRSQRRPHPRVQLPAIPTRSPSRSARSWPPITHSPPLVMVRSPLPPRR